MQKAVARVAHLHRQWCHRYRRNRDVVSPHEVSDVRHPCKLPALLDHR